MNIFIKNEKIKLKLLDIKPYYKDAIFKKGGAGDK